MARNLKFNFPLLFLTLFFALGASKCATIPLDASAAAGASNDDTIILQGGNAKSQKGYLFFQKRTGTPISETLTLIVPKVACQHDTCARYQFFRKDGTPGLSGGITRGSTQATLALADIIGHGDVVSGPDDGEYSGVIQLFYMGNDGHEYTTVMNGFVRLNVLGAGYDPVGCNDPSVAWRVKTGTATSPCTAQFTTQGRSVACGLGCAP